MLVRLQKFLADAGVASRRASEQIILEGRVSINSKVVRELGIKINTVTDEVKVDGRPLRQRRKIYAALHKPPGYICTRSDPKDRKTVFDLLPREWKDLYPVGRLDRSSEGLLFLTNDGDFCLKLTHPRYGMRKLYHVIIEGRADLPMLDKLLKGVSDRGELLKVEKAKILSANNSHSELELELAEGKNREIRRLLAALGVVISRLQRIKIGCIKLGELPLGKWRILTETEIQQLLSIK